MLTHGGYWYGEPVPLPSQDAQEPSIEGMLYFQARGNFIGHRRARRQCVLQAGMALGQMPMNLSTIRCLLHVVGVQTRGFVCGTVTLVLLYAHTGM